MLSKMYKLFFHEDGFFNRIRNQIKISYLLSFEFKPRDDDIYIVTYPRSGTTLMQMIFYQLRTKGDMDFIHISEKIPFLENYLLLLQCKAKKFEHFEEPRIFKTHLSYFNIPKHKNNKYIFIIRDPMDVAYAYYHLYKSTFTKARLSFDIFFNEYFIKGDVQCGLWFKYVKKWLGNRKKLNILYIDYNDLVKNKREMILKIANFVNIEIKDGDLKRIIQKTSIAHMKQYEDKFSYRSESEWARSLIDCSSFIREGAIGSGVAKGTKKQVELCNAKLKKYNLYNLKKITLDGDNGRGYKC